MVVGARYAGGDLADVLADDVQHGLLPAGESQTENVLGEPGRGVVPQLVGAARVQLEHHQHVQERAVVQVGDQGAPLHGRGMHEPVSELRHLDGRRRDPVRAYLSAGGGSQRGVAGERQVGHGRGR
ncbi:hypothetical protein ACIBJF_52455 [Streptomyces sp. NPDC050743]|uniref:hypothetical protein n=1 Tax=Streptomyces sp. NPDC050743 TaxID=3365634 RepID=UPI00379ECFE1